MKRSRLMANAIGVPFRRNGPIISSLFSLDEDFKSSAIIFTQVGISWPILSSLKDEEKDLKNLKVLQRRPQDQLSERANPFFIWQLVSKRTASRALSVSDLAIRATASFASEIIALGSEAALILASYSFTRARPWFLTLF